MARTRKFWEGGLSKGGGGCLFEVGVGSKIGNERKSWLREKIGESIFPHLLNFFIFPSTTTKQSFIIQEKEVANYMLVEMLKDTPFENPAKKQIMLTLANKFQSSTTYLFLDPEELYQHTALGNKDQWQELLNLQETQNYIKGQMAALAQISQRKTFQSLVKMALDGNQQAAKQVQELSGVLNAQDTNRTIILHYIKRPQEVNP